MSEISREETTKWLEKSAPIFVCTPSEFERFGFAINKAISDMEKLENIEQIIKKYNLQDITRDDVDDIVSGFEYEIIMAVLGKDIEV